MSKSAAEIFSLMEKTFEDKHYLNTLRLSNKYLSLEDANNSLILETMIAICLIKLKKTEGYERLNNISSQNSNLNIYLGKMLYRHNLYDEAIPFFKNACYDMFKRHSAYYFLGRIYMFNGDYDIALEYFKECYSYTLNENRLKKLEHLINDLENHFLNNKFIKISYNVFKTQNVLSKGYIVYVKPINTINTTIPYLICEIEEDNIWAFPLINKQIPTYHLKATKNSGKYEKYISPTIVKFNINDIDTVISLVDDDEFNNILQSMYNYYEQNNNHHLSNLEKDFYQKYSSSLILKK